MADESSPVSYGGQAVIEGVLIRGRRHAAVAVRRPDGSLALRIDPLGAWATTPLRRIPFLRGVVALTESLMLGMRAMHFSANASMDQEETTLSPWVTGGIVGASLSVAIGIFFLGPTLAVGWLERYLASSLAMNLLEGLLRLALFLGYLYAIGKMPEIRRVFAYHGAEHKTVHAFEAGAALEVAGVRPFSTAHPRCGTSFLLIVFVVALFAFAVVGQPPLWLRLLSRVALLPVIAGMSYELLRFSAAYGGHILGRGLASSGLALQAMTTREPDDEQIRVAIAAFRAVQQADAAETAL